MRKAALANPELCYCGPLDGGLVDPLGGRGGPWTTVETVETVAQKKKRPRLALVARGPPYRVPA